MQAQIKFYLPKPYYVQGSLSHVSPLIARLPEEIYKVRDNTAHLFGYFDKALKDKHFNYFELSENYKINENTETGEETEVRVSIYYSRVNNNRFVVSKIVIATYGNAKELLGLAGVQTSIDLNDEFAFENLFKRLEEVYTELKAIVDGLRPPADTVEVVFIAY